MGVISPYRKMVAYYNNFAGSFFTLNLEPTFGFRYLHIYIIKVERSTFFSPPVTKHCKKVAGSSPSSSKFLLPRAKRTLSHAAETISINPSLVMTFDL